MEHEPRSLVGDAKGPMQLMGAHALLTTAQEVDGLEPLMQRDMAALEKRADRNREVAAALLLAAGVQAGAMLIASDLADVEGAAMRADRTVRPTDRFKMLPGFFGVV